MNDLAPVNGCHERSDEELLEIRRALDEEMQALHKELMTRIRDQDRPLDEFERKKGILEILFGVRTRVW